VSCFSGGRKSEVTTQSCKQRQQSSPQIARPKKEASVWPKKGVRCGGGGSGSLGCNGGRRLGLYPLTLPLRPSLNKCATKQDLSRKALFWAGVRYDGRGGVGVDWCSPLHHSDRKRNNRCRKEVQCGQGRRKSGPDSGMGKQKFPPTEGEKGGKIAQTS